MNRDDDLRSYVERLEAELRGEIAELRERIRGLEGVPPTCETESSAPGNLWELASALRKAAPTPLAEELKATCAALREAVERGAANKAQAQLIVEIVELCEESRRGANLADPFYEKMEERLASLIEQAQLEPVVPHAGQVYRPQEHLVLRSVRGTGVRDTVERCQKRGFRWQGQLLKKAEVSVFL